MKKVEIAKYWGNVRALTLAVLDRFPGDKMEFRPIGGIRTVSEQCCHIAAVERYIRRGLTEGDWELAAKQKGELPSKDAIRDTLLREHNETANVLRVLPDSLLEGFHQTKFGRLTGESIIYVGIDEEIHHRGNLYIYLRLLGIEPPQMIQNYYQLFLED
jgi:uncharacterized damage-inducible protein DinB